MMKPDCPVWASLGTNMPTLLVSSKGQIVLPAELRRRLGMGAGARIEVVEESDGLKLRVVRSVATADMTSMAGLVKAPARGVPRRLEDFDPASLLTRSRRRQAMRALDTNVLARFFVDDADDAQAAKQRPAAAAALAERSFVSVTVLLELEWVLRGFYELPTRDVSRVLRALASIEHITLEDRDAVLVAVDAFDKGLDFRRCAAPGSKFACFRIRDIRPETGEAGKGSCAEAAGGVA
jgi:AbrB family looped-hinge helix DNA binding protein